VNDLEGLEQVLASEAVGFYYAIVKHIYSNKTKCKVTKQISHASLLNDAIDVYGEYMIISMHPSNYVAFIPETPRVGGPPDQREMMCRQQCCFILREYKVDYWVQRPDMQFSWRFYSVIWNKFLSTASK